MRRSPAYIFRILKRSKLITGYEVLRDISEPVEKKRVIYIRAELGDGTIIDIHEVWLRSFLSFRSLKIRVLAHLFAVLI